MSRTIRTPVKSRPPDMGRPVLAIVAPTFGRDHRCTCSWAVLKAGPGLACLSRLLYAHSLCPVREHKTLMADAA